MTDARLATLRHEEAFRFRVLLARIAVAIVLLAQRRAAAGQRADPGFGTRGLLIAVRTAAE